MEIVKQTITVHQHLHLDMYLHSRHKTEQQCGAVKKVIKVQMTWWKAYKWNSPAVLL